MKLTLKERPRILSKVLFISIPLLIFFLFNILTPYWWDDFIMGCYFTDWFAPHTKLLSSLSDVFQSTVNLYHTHHGRFVTDFLNFLFMFFKNKMIFNICNTAVYCLLCFLICYHVCGSVKKISPVLFLLVNILLWLFVPQWGQNLLWLTGSFNYLWSGIFLLLFLIPYRKRFDNSEYKPNILIALLWLTVGILSGWTMEDSVAGTIVLLFAYFIYKKIHKDKFTVFEICGFLGLLMGFYLLLADRHGLFPGIAALLKNIARVIGQFIIYDGVLACLIICLWFELAVFRKEAVPRRIYGFLIGGAGTVAAMVIPGYFGNRSSFMTQVFLIIVLLSLGLEIKPHLKRRYKIMIAVMLAFIFTPSFYKGTKSILQASLLSFAREQYIDNQKQAGNMDVNVKSPIFVDDSHCGLYGGIDILCNPADKQFLPHNGAQATWYGLKSLRGIPATVKGYTFKSFGQILKSIKKGNRNKSSLLMTAYNNWELYEPK